jgi:DNA polymerase III epsilon subunit-like protein/predicted transcriptional regulator
VTNIGDSLFAYCYKLKEIIIPKGTRKKFEEMLPYQKDKLVEQEQYPQESTKTKKLFLFFDTETTGLPSDWDAPSSDVTNWPRIVQISWIISNDRGQTISKHNYIVKPEGFSIPIELAKIHGITTERALKEGEKLNNILDYFLRDLQQVSYIVGHNISFDKNVVAAEIYRKGSEKLLDEIVIDKYVDMLETKPTICTMLSSTNFCRIPRYDNGYKWPKLSELYYKLFNKELVDAHDSSVDVQATFDCFWRLKELGIIGNIDIEDNVIQENEQCVHINKIRFTTFLFNSSIFSGYGGSTSDFSKRLYADEWKLFISNERPQDLMFSYPNTLHVMDNGRGINGTYSLKDKNSLLLSIDGESLYLHCVYYNDEIIVFQFDQSNEHLLLYQKHLVFSSVNDIHNYLDRVKQYVDTQRGNARKKKEIELKERADSLIRDIKKRDIEISDKTVESLKSKMKQLCSIVGPEEANKYQPIIDKAIKENENRKRIAAEEKRVNEEERKRKRAKLVRKGSIRLVIILYAVLWITACYYHFSHEWETCGLVLLWSSIILFYLVIATILSFKDIILPNRVKVIHIFFGIITIICSCIYMYDWSKYEKCFNYKVFNPFVSKYYYADNDDNPILDYHNFSVIRGDIYLNETAFHLFDNPVKKIIFEQINHSEDLYFINNYIYKNKSGYYLQEAKNILYYTTDQLCRKAKTLGDWKYIISYAPEEYLSDAKEEYEHLDSIVWNDEELAYQNAKSLNTIEAYDKFMFLYGKGKYCHEISTLLSNLKSNGAKRYNAH